MRKLKRPKGFYKELREYNAVFRESKKVRRTVAVEYWLKHLHDSSKDIHFYAKWDSVDDIEKSFNYTARVSDESFESQMSIRLLEAPRTRKEKAIHKCRLSLMPHISDILKAV